MLKAALGNQAAVKQLRNGMAALHAIDGVMTPYRKGDYEAALQAAEAFRQDGEVSASYCFYRGSCLAHLGRLPEAETWLRRNISLRQKKELRHLSIGYTTLGHLLVQDWAVRRSGGMFCGQHAAISGTELRLPEHGGSPAPQRRRAIRSGALGQAIGGESQGRSRNPAGAAQAVPRGKPGNARLGGSRGVAQLG
jgi:tetratricopeptide (TPR) repeat protein